jgi:hypothetical protein
MITKSNRRMSTQQRAPIHIMSLNVLGNASGSAGRGGTDGTSSGERR